MGAASRALLERCRRRPPSWPTHGRLRLHRRLVQPASAPLGARLRFTRQLRTSPSSARVPQRPTVIQTAGSPIRRSTRQPRARPNQRTLGQRGTLDAASLVPPRTKLGAQSTARPTSSVLPIFPGHARLLEAVVRCETPAAYSGRENHGRLTVTRPFGLTLNAGEGPAQRRDTRRPSVVGLACGSLRPRHPRGRWTPGR